MPSLPRLDEVFGIPAPAERTGVVGVVVRDVSLDRCDTRVQRVEDRILQPLPRQFREDPLDGVHPRRRGRGDVEGPVGTALQPRVDFDRLVRRDVVADDVHRGFGRDPRGDRIADGEELLRAVPFDRPADVAADDVADLDRELRVARDLEGLDRMRPEAVTEEDVAHRGDDPVAHCRSQGPERPVPGVLRGRRHRQRDPGLHPVPPAPDRRLRQARPPQGFGQPASRSELQDDPGPPDRLLKAPRIADDVFEARAPRPKARSPAVSISCPFACLLFSRAA